MCLYLLSNLQAFILVFMTVMGTEVLQRESERACECEQADDTGFTSTPCTGSLHIVVSCEWLVHH